MFMILANLRRILAFTQNGATEILRKVIEKDIFKEMDRKLSDLKQKAEQGDEGASDEYMQVFENKQGIEELFDKERFDFLLDKEADKVVDKINRLGKADVDDLISAFIQRDLLGMKVTILGDEAKSVTPFDLPASLRKKHRDFSTVTKDDLEALWTYHLKLRLLNYGSMLANRRTDVNLEGIVNGEGRVVEHSTGVDDTMKEVLEKETYCSIDRNLNQMLNDMSKWVVQNVIRKIDIDDFGNSTRKVDKLLMACFRVWVKILRGKSNANLNSIKGAMLADRDVQKYIPDGIITDNSTEGKKKLDNMITIIVTKLKKAIQDFMKSELTEQQQYCFENQLWMNLTGRRASKVARKMQANRDKAIRYLIAAYVLGADVFDREGYEDPKKAIEKLLTKE